MFIWKGKTPKIANTILKENKFGEPTLPNFKTQYKATVTKAVWYWLKSRQIDQQNGKKRPEIDPNKLNSSLNKKQRQYNETKTFFSNNGSGTTKKKN